MVGAVSVGNGIAGLTGVVLQAVSEAASIEIRPIDLAICFMVVSLRVLGLLKLCR